MMRGKLHGQACNSVQEPLKNIGLRKDRGGTNSELVMSDSLPVSVFIFQISI